jgi:hypothetical protein
MLLLLFNRNLAAGKFAAPTPPVTTSLPGGSQRRRGSVWEPSVAFAIAAAQEERRLWRETQEAAKAPVRKRRSATSTKILAKPTDKIADLLFLTLEAVQLAIKRAETEQLRDALRKIEREEQEKLAALAREEIEAAQVIMTILMGRKEPIGDEEAAAILMNMLMNVKH